MKEDKIIIDSLKEIKESKEYWLNICSKPMEKLVFPRDFFMDFQYDKGIFNFALSGDLYNKLNNITNGENLTIYTLLLSVFKIELFKYNRQNDLIIGIPVYFKSDQEDSLNKVVLTRSYLEDNMTFKQVLLDLRKTIIEAYKNQIVSLEEIVKVMNVDNDIMSLLPINFAMKNIHNQEHIEYIVNSPKNEITFLIEKVNNTILFKVIFNSKLFKIDTIQRFSDMYLNILYQVFNNLEVRLFEIEMVTEEEKYKLLHEFNDTYTDYPRDQTIHELFEEQVQKTPDNIAIVFEDKKLTYRELNEKANRLAITLREKVVKSDSIVPIMLERSLEMIVGMLGILKSGGAYLPIDPEYPEDRIKYMLEDSKAKILLTQECLLDKVDFDGEIINIQNENVYGQNGDNLDTLSTSKELAYVIYTSGSTGNPKGVMVEQKSVIRLVKNTNYISFEQNDKILQTGTLAFDASTFEIWGAILNGLELHLCSKNMILNTESMEQYINKNNITILWLTASLFNFMAEERPAMFTNLRYLLAGGDVLSTNHINKVIEKCRNLKIINGYGPTENTTFSTCFLIDKEYKTNIPIGRPISNSMAYIVDKHNKLQAIGIYGELCVGGEGLARGYLNNPELTAEKFIESPFVSGERMYKTGDLARWLPDGNIEFLGRIDHQVKIRGFRIELGEIESQLLNYEAIKETIVLDREDENGTKYLCAYLVSEKELTAGELRNYLLKNLPEYMIPSYFVQLEKIPLTQNGKTDRKALPEPDGSMVTGVEYEAARNGVEEKLVAIWRDVLGTERVGINDNFFELGGHSLNAITLVSRIHKELNVEVPIREIFKFPTIKGISKYVESTEISIYSSIEIVEKKEYYEASSAQKRMYMLQQFDLKSTGYNMPGVMVIEGRLNVERLEKSFTLLIRRHETLRTSFETIGDKIIQRVNENVNFKLNYFEVDSIESQEKVVDNIIKDFVKAFDLNKAPLLRVGLIKLEEDKHILMFDMHHIISDGVSMGILTNEFAKIYDGNELEGLRIQYKDYSQWQNSILKSEVMEEQKKYWIDRFSNEIPVLNMPSDFIRPTIQSFKGENISFKLDKELTRNLKRIAKETGSTMYMVLLSGVNILLSKYSGQEEVIVGSPIAGRPHVDLEKIIGMFVNTITMRNYPEGSRTYEDFLKEVKENALKAYENQDYQFDELVDKLSIPRDISRNPLFDVMFTMQNLDSQDIELKDLVFKGYKQEHKIAKFDLTFSASEVKEEIIFELQYSTNLYKRETIERMVEHFVNIIKVVTGDIKIKLNEIEMLTEEEKYKLLYEFNDTYTDYPRDKTIHEVFEEQVEKTPDNIAVVFEDKKLTYRELNDKANRLARTLREKGIKADSIVGIMVERSVEMIVGIMGILKAGGAYLPIDSEYPKDRIKYMIEDSNTRILLTQSSLLDRAEANVTVLDIQDENMYAKNGYNLENINTSKDLAYVIYTSGSTGNPKGTEVMHYNISRVVKNTNYISITKDDIILQLSNYAFDGSVFDIYGALLNGAKLILIEKEIVLNTEKLSALIIHEKVSVFFVTTALFNILVDNQIECFNNIRKVMFGGERISISHAKKALEYMGKNKIIHVYGPTESTVFTTYYFINDLNENTENVPVGGPIANTKIYIIGKNNKLSPIGIPGELCIAGEGLARGYLNSPELTAEKFALNLINEGERIYKTGDLARWLPDGNIEFLGRIDQQVKIRGFRIELGEIENQLLNYKTIKEIIVIDREDENGTKYLCAYLVSEKELTVGELRNYLSKNLPEYMIPSYFVQLDKMPLTPNGKIDRKALPEPDESIVTGEEYEAPRNEVEEKLVVIWKDVLGTKRVGINDNFFELGGHSLKATTLVSKIHKELNVEVPLREIFKLPTIKGINQYIESKEKSIYSSIKIVEKKKYYEASSAQKRLYAIQMMDKESTLYNMPMILELTGKVDQIKIRKAIEALIQKHESFRTSFHMEGEEIVQKIQDKVELQLEYEEAEGKKEVDKILARWVRPFELDKAPLLRGGIIKEGLRQLLVLDMHHIISDGSTMGILAEDFMNAYDGVELKVGEVQYKEYAAWEKEQKQNGKWEKQKVYWKKEYEGEIPVLELPMDGIRGKLEDNEGQRIVFEIEEEIVSGLKEVVGEMRGTLYMGLMAGYSILLSKYSRQEDIVIGTPIAGRRHAQMEKVAGMFVNTLAIRTQPQGEKTIEIYLRDMKQKLLEAYENQEYPYEELVEEVKVKRDFSRNPLFDVMLVLQNTEMKDIELSEVQIRPYEIESNKSLFDITLIIVEVKDKLVCEMEYRSKLYGKDIIERMIKHYVRILKEIGENKHKAIKEIELLDEEEKQQLLKHFNNTKVKYDREKTVVELFEEHAENSPESISIVQGEHNVTYRELNERANRLAWMLNEAGVRPESIVALMLENSIETIVAILAIQKSGGAYLPVDVKYPLERIEYILKDSNSEYLISRKSYVEGLEYSGNVWDIQEEEFKAAHRKCHNIGKNANTKNLAYVIYTSGSTGKPKGVEIEHGNLSNQIIGLMQDYGYEKMKNHMLYSKTIFDVSVQHIFTALCSGSVLHLMTDKLESDYYELYKYAKENKVEFIDMVPAQMKVMVEHLGNDCKDMRFVLGGETFPISLYKKIIKKIKADTIYNVYGPTETTINALIYQCTGEEQGRVIPIGKPVRNYSAYILDGYNQLQPIGVYGELCVSGHGLARGYLRRPELTAEKFVKNPFEAGERMYRTGDLARWTPDGNIEFLGRIDHQVKIRGFRIELGEIENVLGKQAGVKAAVVLDREDESGGKYLCAYIVKEEEITIEAIRESARKELPDYMVPGIIVEIEEIPLTSSGKIDRNTLLNIEVYISREKEYEAPRNEIEEKLVEIWTEILGIEQIGINDNFFGIGGHSLKATMLSGRIQKDLQAEIGVRDVFETPNIKELGEKIRKIQGKQYEMLSPLEKRESYVVSSAQKRLYAIQTMDKESTSYNMPMVLELTGRVDRIKIEKAIEALIQKHEALRTSFHIEEEIVQKIQGKVELKLEYEEAKGKEEVEKILASWIRPFELDKAPLMRCGIIKEGQRNLLLIDMHHIVSDGTTMGILVEDFVKAYAGTELKTESVQYKEYAAWEKEQKEKGNWESQKQYWKKEYEGEIPILELPMDGVRGKIEDKEGEIVGFEIGEEVVTGLKEAVAPMGGTLYMGLIAGYSILLSKYSGQEDIVIGSPIAGRRHAQMEKVAGMFVNTLAIRTRPEGEKTIEYYLREIRQKLLGAYENQEYPYEKLVEEVNVGRDLSRNPLFDVMIILQNTEMKELGIPGVQIKPYEINSKRAKFDITLNIEEDKDRLVCEVEYRSKLYNKNTIERMMRHYVKILKEIGGNKDKAIKEIEVLELEEKHQLLKQFNNTTVDYNRNKTIVELFEEKVEKIPNNIAVIFGDKKLTYRELNKKANKLAATLRAKGVKQDTIVAIMVERSLEMVVGIMAIIKAGGAYLPIVTEYPEDRIKYILQDSKTNVLLVQNKYTGIVDFNGEIINLEDENVYSVNSENLQHINSSRDLAYVIYTSGSTGKPKGVMVEHKSAVNILTNMQKDYPIMEDGVYLLKTTYTFDVSITELFGWFMGSGKLAILPEGRQNNLEHILEAINEYKVTHINFVPSMMNVFLDGIEEKNSEKISSLKYTFVAGESFSRELAKRCSTVLKDVRVENIYGPTETTIYVTRYSMANFENGQAVPIGKPLDNVKAYITDKYNKLLPIGAAGELCIAGECVTRGYLNKAELTAEKFIENPFIQGERMYKTGDLARWLPNGNIEFLGRIDHQVKVRGFRIELGEIESQLLIHELVKEAIVINRQDNSGAKYLCAYVVSDKQLTVGELRELLSKNLPEYMIPSYFVQLDKMPLTTNGKLDRSRLPEPEGNVVTGTEYKAPRNNTEMKLVKIWQEVLEVVGIGIHDNFFELGGHSIKAIKLLANIHKKLNLKLEYQVLYANPSISEMAAFISNNHSEQNDIIQILESKEYYATSYVQRRMWLLHQLNPTSTAYNMPGKITVNDDAPEEAIEAALNALVIKHESFRTSFIKQYDEILQKVEVYEPIKLEVEDLMELQLEKKQQKIKEIELGIFNNTFDLTKSPLFRFKCIKLDKAHYEIVFCMHHIIFDGWSIEVIRRDFYDFYNSYNIDGDIHIEPFRVQYKDFAAWQNQMIEKNMDKAMKYWKDKLNNCPEKLRLPERIKNTFDDNDGHCSVLIGKDISNELNKMIAQNHSSVFSVFLSSLYVLLYKVTGQKDMVIGTAVSGREHYEVDNIIGCFVNTLLLREEIIKEQSFSDFLKNVNENVSKALTYQTYPLELVLEKLSMKYPNIQVFLNVLNIAKNNEISNYNQIEQSQNVRVKFDIVFYVIPSDEGIRLTCEYKNSKFSDSDIQFLLSLYVKIVKETIDNNHKPIFELGSERRKKLGERNKKTRK